MGYKACNVLSVHDCKLAVIKLLLTVVFKFSWKFNFNNNCLRYSIMNCTSMIVNS
jgi:hypothetical protein